MGLECKNEETYLYATPTQLALVAEGLEDFPDTLGGEPSPLLTIISVTDDGGPRSIIVREGPEFLKRRFVRLRFEGEEKVMPWRHEDDMYTKSCISANRQRLAQEGPDIMSGKFLGLMIDTMATNPISYSAMKAMYLQSLGKPTQVTTADVEKHFDCAMGDSALAKNLKKSGITINQAITALDMKGFFRQFVWDDEWRNAWAITHGLMLYNPDGLERTPKWGDVFVTPQEYYYKFDRRNFSVSLICFLR